MGRALEGLGEVEHVVAEPDRAAASPDEPVAHGQEIGIAGGLQAAQRRAEIVHVLEEGRGAAVDDALAVDVLGILVVDPVREHGKTALDPIVERSGGAHRAGAEAQEVGAGLELDERLVERQEMATDELGLRARGGGEGLFVEHLLRDHALAYDVGRDVELVLRFAEGPLEVVEVADLSTQHENEVPRSALVGMVPVGELAAELDVQTVGQCLGLHLFAPLDRPFLSVEVLGLDLRRGPGRPDAFEEQDPAGRIELVGSADRLRHSRLE